MYLHHSHSQLCLRCEGRCGSSHDGRDIAGEVLLVSGGAWTWTKASSLLGWQTLHLAVLPLPLEFFITLCDLSDSRPLRYFFIEMKFRRYTVNHFRVNKVVAFSTFTMLCCHHHYLAPKHSHLPKGNPMPFKQSLPLPSPWQPPICFLFPWICPFWTFHINGVMLYVAFCVWLLSLSIMVSKLIHIVACVNAQSFLWQNHIPEGGWTVFVYPLTSW